MNVYYISNNVALDALRDFYEHDIRKGFSFILMHWFNLNIVLKKAEHVPRLPRQEKERHQTIPDSA